MDAWWAVRSDDPSNVLKRLATGERRRGTLGQARALATTHHDQLFVSDSIEGWVLVIAPGLSGVGRDATWLCDLLEWASLDLGDVQAFVADAPSGHHAWLRATDGKLGRCMVYDGAAYAFTHGRRSAHEPNFPQLLATPTRADVLAVATAWSLDPTRLHSTIRGTFATLDVQASAAAAIADLLGPPTADEDARSFSVRVMAAFMSGNWRGKKFRGAQKSIERDQGARWSWPAVWGEPTDVRGSSAWILDDATIVLQLVGGMAMVPATVGEWLAVTRRSTKPGWEVLAGSDRAHDGGKAIEIFEACSEQPRATRVTSYLFAPPHLGVMAITCPDVIPPSRGSEVLASFASLRLR